MKRTASAQWEGDLKTGKGAVSTESGVLAGAQYSFTTRFESGKGTNPEELVAAAHAGCFTMALSAELGKANLVPQACARPQPSPSTASTPGGRSRSCTCRWSPRCPAPRPRPSARPPRRPRPAVRISKLFKTKITMDAKLEP